MPKYRRKPVVIEAFQWTGDVRALEDWRDFMGEEIAATLLLVEHPFHTSTLYILELQEKYPLAIGDWIVVSATGQVNGLTNLDFTLLFERAGS